MYVCMYVCVYVCMCVCVCVCMRIGVCRYVCRYIRTYILVIRQQRICNNEKEVRYSGRFPKYSFGNPEPQMFA